MNGQTKFVADKILECKPDRVLNIGFRYDSDMTLRDISWDLGSTFEVLEIYGPNCETMRNLKVADRIYEMDVKDIDQLEESWDIIIWLHGPEHVYWDEFQEIRHKIESKAKQVVIYQAPIGEHPQGALYNNPYERHVEALYPKMFADLGYKITSHDGKGSHDYDFLVGEKTFSAVRDTREATA